MTKRVAPWVPPSGHVVVERRWKYAPPPWVMFEALVDDHARWLTPQADELEPKVVGAQRPTGVIFRPWVDPLASAVEVRIGPDGQGAVLTVLVYADREELPVEERRSVRHRLGTLFGAELRDWVDESHW